MSATVYVGTSLDGFIARENGDLDWLHAEGAASSDEDYGYKAFMTTVDAVVMGRNTYEKVLTFGKWPYDKPVVVLTSRELALAAELRDAAVPERSRAERVYRIRLGQALGPTRARAGFGRNGP